MPIWDRCLSQLEVELSEQQLNTWIRPLQAQEKNSNLKLMAPNQFVLSWVETNFYPRIKEIAAAVAKPEELTVMLEIGSGPASVHLENGADSTPQPMNLPVSELNPLNSSVSALPETSSLATEEPTGPRVKQAQMRAQLNPVYSFETFVEGKSNQFGRAAALQICQNPGTAYNPFFICGASGLGKTHLMQSVGHGILDYNPNANVFYLNSERYVQEMVSALQRNTMDDFKRRYRNLDALLIDDIQFFAGKGRTQEEFFHTFNALYESGSQIIMTCDRYPKEVEGLEDRLVSRFQGGMTVAVEPPDLETRVAILNSKAEQKGIQLPSEVSFFIANCIRSNVRELEGALRRVVANAEFTHSEVTLDFAKEALRDLIAVQAKLVTIENIQKTVAEYYKIRLSDLSAKTRSRSIARPRQIAMSLSKELTRKSLPEIGKAFGGRDHTTVLHACKMIKKLRATDILIDEDYSNLLRVLSA